jgi:hypothetical protein
MSYFQLTELDKKGKDFLTLDFVSLSLYTEIH